MVKEILTSAGFIENKTFKETRFITPPRSTYAVFMDSFTRRGADTKNLIKEHDDTIELYSYKPDPIAESNIEREFDKRNIEYDKADRLWINEELLYQVVYTFSYTEK